MRGWCFTEKYVNDPRSGSGRCGIKEIYLKAISIAEYQELRGSAEGSEENDNPYAAFDLDKLIQERGLKVEMISASDEAAGLTSTCALEGLETISEQEMAAKNCRIFSR